MATDRLRDSPVIILDTNALFMPFQFKLNLDSQLEELLGDYQIIIPHCVFNELRRLEKTEKFGTFALRLAGKKTPPEWYLTFEKEFIAKLELENTKSGDITIDTELLRIAMALNGIVLTNDRELQKTLRAHGLRTISLRARKYLKLNSIE
jgi:rRNA-processing protein FCF1